MADPNMTLVLRIQADLRQAEQALAALNQQLGQAGQQGQQAGSRLDSATTAIDRLASESAAAAAAIERVSAAAGASSQAAARLALGVGTIEQTQRKLVELRQQYQLVTSDSTLSAKQRAEAEINYQRSVAATLTQLRALRGGLADNGQAMQRAGLTAGQYQQAMRLLPMQLTDVAVSLASGMPVWMVAIQQGGQIRDSFGGIGAAARAVVSSINPMVAAVTAATVAGGALLLAFQEGSQEAVRLNEALILTGGYAGTTAGQLASLAREMDNLDGVTQSSASAALTQVAASGQFAGEQVRLVAVAAEQMRAATGKSIEETIAEFVKLRKDPVSAILELNDKQHFLTQAQLEQIQTLKEQGREQAAVTEAMRVYAGVIAERTPQVTENLGLIERKWREIKSVMSETRDGLLSIGRASDDAQRITELTQKIAYLKSTLGTGFEPLADTQGEIAKLSAELDKLRGKQALVAQGAPGVVDTAAEKERMKAEEAFDRLALGNLDKKAQLEREIAEIRKLGLKAGKDQAEIDKQIAAARARYEESLPTPRKDKAVTDDAATRMLQQLRNQQATLEGQLGSTDKLTEAQRQQAQFVQLIADLKEKKILTAEQKSLLAGEAAIKAQLAQNVALDEQLRKRQALAENARTNAGLEAELLRSQGKAGEAASIELQAQFAQAMKDLEKTGNQRGIQLMKDVLPIRQAQIQLDEIGKQIDKTFSRNDRAEQSIGVQLDAGLITESEARQKILDLRRKEADELERQLPILEEIAAKGGSAGEAAQIQIDAIRDKITLARNAATDFERALKSGLAGGIQDALTGLADGTLNLRDAITGLVSSVADAMAQLAAQQLAEQATAGIMGMLGGGQNSGQQGSEGMTAGAAAVTGSAIELGSAAAAIIPGAEAVGVSATALGSAAASMLTGAAAIEAAAASLAAANAMSGASGESGSSGAAGAASALSSLSSQSQADAISAASSQGAAEMGSSITSASEAGSTTFSSALDSIFSQGADLFSNLFGSISSLFSGGGGDSIFSGIMSGLGGLFGGGGAVAAATGGHVTGPGTGTSDSISAWLSNGEFVTRSAVTQQPGALDFLHAFNARGMSALQDYARVRHATGGLAGVPAPALPAPSLGTTRLAEPAKQMAPEVSNNFSFAAVFDTDEAARRIGDTSSFENGVMKIISRNKSALKAALNS